MTPRTAQLGELCKMDREGLRPNEPCTSRLPFVGVENIVGGSGILNFSTDSRIGIQKSTAFRFDERHVLYAKLRPYLNKVATPDFAGRCSTELVPLLPRDGVDRDFLAYLLRRKETVEFVMASVTGSRMPRTDMKALMSMRVPLPPLDEQRRIVDVLNTAARIERLRARANERLREFIPALFIKMFGDPIDNPMGWERRYLRDLSDVQGGLQVTKKRADRSLEKPYLRVANVLRDQLVLNEIKYIRLTAKELERVRLRRGDLLIVEGHGNAAEIGRAAIWDDGVTDCVHQNHLIRVRPDQSLVIPEFACAYLNSTSGRQHLIRHGRTTSGLNTISTSNVKDCILFFPPLEHQMQFAEAVTAARDIAVTVQSASRTVSTLSGSLMSRLLDGSSPVGGEILRQARGSTFSATRLARKQDVSPSEG